MRINNNVMAFNANRNLGISNNSLGKSLEKLSSGYRINRAGDDAAGLVISQKLRAEVSGLKQATRNAQDGISFAQTAEGALGEVHNMLNRMRDLSVQAANDTNDAAARTAIKAEVDALALEIDRIGTDTTFSGAAVFTATALNFQVGSEGTGNQIQVTVGVLDAGAIGGEDLTALAVDTAATDGDDLQVGKLPPQVNDRFQAFFARHDQVGDDQIRRMGAESMDALGPVPGHIHLKTLAAQEYFQKLPHLGVVFNDQDIA